VRTLANANRKIVETEVKQTPLST